MWSVEDVLTKLKGVPYKPEDVSGGYWGVPTATIDWCEENYVVSPYIAEAINTTTNAIFVVIAGYALYNSFQHRLEKRFMYSCLGFMLVGLGSWAFHMTLRYEAQLLDELPMIYATCIPFWNVFEFGHPQHSRKLAIAVIIVASAITAIYLHLKDPSFHQAAYGVLNFAIIFKSHAQVRALVHNKRSRSDFTWMLSLGLGVFFLGYICWMVDIHMCSFWRGLRHQVGMPYGFFLECHGWWHLFTGIGVYMYLIYLECLRTYMLGVDDMYVLVWKWHIVPVVQLRSKTRPDAIQKKLV